MFWSCVLIKRILASSFFGKEHGLVLIFSDTEFNTKFVVGPKCDGSLWCKLQPDAGSEEEEDLLFERYDNGTSSFTTLESPSSSSRLDS